MDNTTIEEKAKELYPDETGTFLEMPNQSKVILQRKAFIAGASLQTPCVELEKEVERLKGLIEKQWEVIFYSTRPSSVHEGVMDELFKNQWQKFKTENNL